MNFGSVSAPNFQCWKFASGPEGSSVQITPTQAPVAACPLSQTPQTKRTLRLPAEEKTTSTRTGGVHVTLQLPTRDCLTTGFRKPFKRKGTPCRQAAQPIPIASANGAADHLRFTALGARLAASSAPGSAGVKP